ncbi:MAG: ABC transporter permease [Bryobacterales bacterium]|nr:ABC transporter permease [Bryobacterales bacterium]
MTAARLLRISRLRLRSLFQKYRADAELARELAFHFDALVQENLAAGMAEKAARQAAARTLGNASLLEEQCRDQRRLTWFHDFKGDARYALRMMRNNPGFTAIAAASLALGIGAHTAILGAIDQMAFGALPFRDPDRIVRIRTYSFDDPQQNVNASLPDYFAFKEQTEVFERIGCALADQKNLGGSENGEPPERIYGQGFSSGVFEALGVRPLLGRTFADTDFQRGPPRVIVLSYRLWQRHFRADPDVVGKKIALNGSPVEIVGVMPRDFRFAEEPPEYWVPLSPVRNSLQAGVRYYVIVARLKRGRTITQAQGELDRVAAQLARDFPETHVGWGARVQPLREALFGWITQPLLTMEGAVALVLLIACANVAGLLLARGESRRQEIAMRVALGARRGRILRQLLTESLMLSLLAAILGLAVAWLGLQALVKLTPPPAAPRLMDIPLNLRMLVLAGVTAVITTIVFGAGPAFTIERTFVFSRVPGATSGRRQTPVVRAMLLSAQIALAFVLLVCSGLFMKSYARLAGRDLNFDPRGVLTFDFRVPVDRFLRVEGEYRGFPYMAVDPSARDRLQRILESVRRVPGVESIAGISNPPVNSLIVPTLSVQREGAAAPAGDTAYFLVTPNLFATLKTPFIRGRDFDERDTPGAEWVAIVNETAARKFWPGEDPIGKRFTLDSVPDDRPRQVIGIVRDIPTRSRSITPEPVIYASYVQQPSRYRLPWATILGQMTFLVRTSGSPMSLVAPVARAVAEVDPEIAAANIAPVTQYTEPAMRELFFFSAIMAVFACFAAGLAAISAYGALAYSVSQRTHEIGIRISLGASPGAIAAMMARWTMGVAGTGAVVGVAGALVLTRLLESQLWEVKPADAGTFTSALILLLAAAASACVLPVRRALRIDPAAALRSE